jgi:uncharacterized protein YjgD (DUF1641 family)
LNLLPVGIGAQQETETPDALDEMNKKLDETSSKIDQLIDNVKNLSQVTVHEQLLDSDDEVIIEVQQDVNISEEPEPEPEDKPGEQFAVS